MTGRLNPGPRTRVITAVALAASTVAVGPASAAPTPGQAGGPRVAPSQAAPAADPSLLAALRTKVDQLGQTGDTPPAASPSPTPTPSSTPTAAPTPDPTAPTASADASAQGPVTTTAAPMTQAMPAAALAAYRNAQAALARTDPTCKLSWTLLAGIGTVESDNGQYGGATLDASGVAHPGIIGIALNGSTPGTNVVLDTDHGRWDGDPVYDHAVGPMKFLPGTWAAVGTSAQPGRIANPENINDAALSAGIYLCAGGGELSTEAGQRAAVLRYNNSAAYADTVLALAGAYATGFLAPVNPAATIGTAPATATASNPSAPSGSTAASPTPTPSPTSSTTPASTPTPSATPTPTDSATASPSPADSPATSPTPTPTDSPTASPSPTDTPTTSPTSTPTPSATDSATPTPSPTSSPTPTDSATPTPSASPTPSAAVPGPVTAEVLTLAAPRSVLLTWGPPAGGPAPTGYLVILQTFQDGAWHDVSTLTVADPAASSQVLTVHRGTYRVSVATIDEAGQSDPVTSNPLVVR